MYPKTSITKAELSQRYTDWINVEKITAAFKGFESKKSPGPDGIEPITLKHLSIRRQRQMCIRDRTEAMENETEMSKYLNKILKNKAKKDIGTLKKAMENTLHQD